MKQDNFHVGKTYHAFYESGYHDNHNTSKRGYVFDVERDLGLSILNDFESIPLVVKSVRPGSWASNFHIERGDVILQIGESQLTTQEDKLDRSEIRLIMEMLRPLHMKILKGKYRDVSA